jgi:farnesyl diphosphate synthase
MPEFSPCLLALAVSALLVTFTNSFPVEKKVGMQFAMFGTIMSGGVAYMMQQNPEVFANFWAQFIAMPAMVKFAMSLTVIGAVYFGSAMYSIGLVEAGEGACPAGACASGPCSAGACASGPCSGAAPKSPALTDNTVDFETPADLPASDKEMFLKTFDIFTAEIVADLPTKYELPEESVQWVERMIHYTVAGGKMNRGLSCVDVQRAFCKMQKNRDLTNAERVQAAALGWCIEFLQAFFLVADDVMDDSVTRRGQPCWYRRDDVQMVAINDSFILESCVYKILKRYFGKEACYSQLVDLFLEVTRQTEFGQLLDLTSQPLDGEIDLDRFTMQRYKSIVKYKTAFYSFYLPVALGMIVAGITDAKQYDIARSILCIMGEYFQIQDDVLDCFGAPEVIGKIGTDIQDNKCSWLVVQALERGNAKQRKLLHDNYGQHDTRKVNKVKKLYAEMGLEELFATYEEESYAEIQGLLAQVTDMPKEIFTFLLDKIYKRSK